ncbi:hypothetical protein [Roseomonas sp. WA12]
MNFNTVAATHDFDADVVQFKVYRALVLSGRPGTPNPSPRTSPMLMVRRSNAAPLTTGIADAPEMFEFCVRENIGADIEPVARTASDTAIARMRAGNVKYRFVNARAAL